MLLQLKLTGLWNAVRTGNRFGYGVVLLIGLAMVLGEWIGVHKALDFLDRYGEGIGFSIAKRFLEAGVVVLSAGVTFTSITTAISTVYLSDDLNFLLTQPISTLRVFGLKLLETFLSAAGVPALLTIPAILSIGAYFHAPGWYYLLSTWLILIVYMLPVAMGCLIAVLLMRFAPVGKVKEVATGMGVLLSAGLVYIIRALKPEALLKVTDPQQFDRLLAQFVGNEDTLMPPALAARALWDASQGHFNTAALGVSLISVVALWLAGFMAVVAYREGWIRGLEGTTRALNGKVLLASWGERLYGKLGSIGHILYKDLRLIMRDATQWSQLLVLVALVGVYLVSLSSYPLDGALGVPRFRNVIGFLQLVFQGFLVAGIGIRMAFPVISLEGYGFWLLQTAPVTYTRMVVGKFMGALIPMMAVSVVLAWQTAIILKLGEVMTIALWTVAISSTMVITALGVSLGAAFPRFRADNPSEIAMSPGGILYMVLSMVYVGLLAVIMARPASVIILQGKNVYWTTPEGLLLLGLIGIITVVVTVGSLWWGIRALDRLNQ
ncbi:putative ABC transporter permease subunit [Deinococcus roseus]|uniref:ABC transporter permease n=1 Tax=Deinococcus roseus TaxID=392414 RepID=A0ABQ2D1A9_9DEIO|nr:hypothetical protein [Deinococcus roseus]GGJ40992.1 hypothetical protein GCM10008938_28800 [Deinococcus roseus]